MYLKKCLLMFVATVTFLFTPLSVYAASNVSVWVLEKITRPNPFDEKGNDIYKISYTKAGLISARKGSRTSYTDGKKSTIMLNTASYTYNKKNNLTKSKYKNSSSSPYSTDKYKLDKKGRVKSINGSITLKYNSKGYLSSVPAYQTTYTFDAKGQLTSVKRSSGQAGTFTYWYNSNGHMIKKTNPYNQTYNYQNEYNDKGLLTKQTDDYGQVVTFKYKKMNIPEKNLAYVTAQQKYLYIYYGIFDLYYLPLEGFYK